jgi:hypothetical protein
MTRTIALFGTALALGLAGPAAAQTGMGGVDPSTMTCGDLTAMEQDRQEGAVYFVAGYQFGGMAGVSGATGTSAGSATTGAAGTTATGTDTTTGAATGTDTTAGAATGTTGSTGTGSAAGSSMMASADFDSISVDQILSACADSPDRMVSDIIREESGAASQ